MQLALLLAEEHLYIFLKNPECRTPLDFSVTQSDSYLAIEITLWIKIQLAVMDIKATTEQQEITPKNYLFS